jgi:putative addiction module CopG family antidote
MEVHLQPEQEAFIRQRIQAGRFATPDEALREAVSLLEEQEKRHQPKPQAAERKSLAQLFAESPFRALDLEFPRDKDALRPLAL